MKYVLFVCTHRAGRSQMAQAFFERYAPEDVRAESAGQEPRRKGIWPNVVEAMVEGGLDHSARRSRSRARRRSRLPPTARNPAANEGPRRVRPRLA